MKQDKSFTLKSKTLNKLKGLNVIIIGGTGGLGRAISRVLAFAGASVTVVGRSFRDQENSNIKFIKADLSSIKDSKRIAQNLDVSATDILLFTTGIFAGPKRELTEEGLESDMAVSFLNRLAILKEVAPRMGSEVNFLGFRPRVFVMAYPGSDQLGNIEDLNSEKSYSSMKTHMNTVAGNEALVYDSVSKYPNLRFYGLNPGLVKTNIRDNLFGKGSWKSSIMETMIGWFTNTPEQYANIITPLLVAPELDSYNGCNFNNKAQAIFPSKDFTKAYAAKYISASEKLLKDKKLD
ncbi:putative short-chain dehydrogenase/reductase [Martiniozyma asiatica (nom. inval.)]|nr:putative short-chain dehydrogenase/reductase [Martiniozyma asiatica]